MLSQQHISHSYGTHYKHIVWRTAVFNASTGFILNKHSFCFEYACVGTHAYEPFIVYWGLFIKFRRIGTIACMRLREQHYNNFPSCHSWWFVDSGRLPILVTPENHIHSYYIILAEKKGQTTENNPPCTRCCRRALDKCSFHSPALSPLIN